MDTQRLIRHGHHHDFCHAVQFQRSRIIFAFEIVEAVSREHPISRVFFNDVVDFTLALISNTEHTWIAKYSPQKAFKNSLLILNPAEMGKVNWRLDRLAGYTHNS